MSKKRLNKKQREYQKKQDQALSRQNRNLVRNAVRKYLRFRGNNRQILFVMGDTENMETILLQKVNLGQDRTLLTLPSVNDWIISEYLNREFPEIDETSTYLLDDNFIAKAVQDYYFIRSDEVMVSEKANVMIFRNCKITKDNDLIPINVRPYNLNTWYNEEALTMGQKRIYSGKKLKTFFRLDENDSYSKTYVFQDTILEILHYKGLMEKINKKKLVSDIDNLAEKTYKPSNDVVTYGLFNTDVAETLERFKSEEEENERLNEARKIRK